MILELAVGAGAVAVGIGVYRAMRGRSPDADDEDGRRQVHRGTLRAGDVLLHRDEELWLAGAVHLDGDVPLHLFVVPGGETERWAAELDLPAGPELALLRPTDAVPEGRVPDRLRVEGMGLRTRCRGVVRVHAEGERLPPVTERAELAVLGGAAGRWLVVVDFVAGDRWALAGERLEWSRVDRLPGGH